ncbi:fumarate reductase/succinate dehydrogenase flavoprotein domain protein [Rhizorhabdus wittichii RW1]|uniref:Fumarate reductase/succinate dehydrogenase flavoprotein domain protein n=1 Tax=Rhizorhabdus wittichii (strain DSM 6014 / CCUG 31198 / JCM 15750 / NBRC 105917 / EY 4224 / RW1) TaxID=392499 RepID=A0A9J9HDM8_RHIWR|nr:fumarate reductase/succinate dehydrogenase flavoprotein domain protein [Rhizorhabdus wittichii RW1]
MAYDREVDLLVVGTGAGALVAALRAARAGAEVLVVEKGALWGGTSATSGGGIWIPGSHLAAQAGHPDDLDEAFGYIRRLTAPNVTDEQIRSYVDHAHRMLEWVEREADVHYAALPYPDYYPETEGSREGYRTHLMPGEVDARTMDRAAFDTMQRASPAASLWGRINWKLAETHMVLFRPKGWMKVIVKVMAGYWLDIPQRLRSPRDRRLTLGTALLAQLRKALDRTGAEVWLESPLLGLIEEKGRVAGATVRHGGRELRIGARRGVILAAGGFERNAAMRAAHLPGARQPQASGSQINNEGDALIAAQKLGAAVRNLDSAWWAPVFRIPGEDRGRLSTVERALPHSIIVNQAGRRYANEALSYHRFGEAMMAKSAPGAATDPSWLLFDGRYRARYPAGPVIPGFPDWMLSAAVRKVLVKAPTIETLAAKMKVDPAELRATVDRFNAMVAQGRDEDFGRGDAAYDRLYGDPRVAPNPTLGSLAKAPFYAIPIHLGDIGTNGGLVTDGTGRVLSEGGGAIPGLYAVGNLAASVMGYSYPGAGATLGPAMTFGWLAAADAVRANEPG